MLNHAELTTLEQALRDRLVLSIYINGEVADVAARAQWRTALRNQLDALEASLAEATHAEREDFAATRELALKTVDSYTPGEGAPGWMGFFTPGTVHLAGIVPVPVPTIATWELGAHVGPYIRVLKEARPVIVVVADSSHVRIHRYADRSLSLVASFDREEKVDTPYHMSRPAPQGFSSGTRGRPGADAAQREMRKATDLMLANAAAHIEELAGQDGWVLVGGISVAASALHGRLDQRLATRSSVITLDVHASDAAIAESARAHASRLREADDIERVEAVVSATAKGGTGTLGLTNIHRALVNGQVRELYVTSDFVQKHSDEAAVAIRKAFDGGATVEHVSGEAAQRLDAEGGIAARLRFTLVGKEPLAPTAS
jgi:hypothetical protein